MSADRLFVTLYLDEDVSVLVAELLRAHGFDVLCTREAQHLGASDAAQLRFSSSQSRAILTHNRVDFESLHRSALTEHRSHAGIIIANRRASDADLARRVMKILDLFSADDITNQLFYI